MESGLTGQHSTSQGEEGVTLKFEDWLIDQQYREDVIGDLARAPSRQKIDHKVSRRKTDEDKDWTEIVISIADPGYIAVFN